MASVSRQSSSGVKKSSSASKQARSKVLNKNLKKRRVPKETISDARMTDASSTVEELILNHRENGRKLARSFLRRWRIRMSLEEVDSVVDLTLCEAANRFDSSKGAAFMTFFFYHLRGQMVRAVENSVQQSSLMVNFCQTSDLDVTEWAQQTGAMDSMVIPESVCPEKNENPTPEHLFIRRESIEKCHDACLKLDSLEQEVLVRSYNNGEALVDIAKALGYSRCHISRVKKKAIERLRGLLEEAGLKGAGVGEAVNSKVANLKTRKRRSRRIPDQIKLHNASKLIKVA